MFSPRKSYVTQGFAHSGQHQPPLRKINYHSDKIATTTNSLISTKISTPMKMLSLNYQLLYVTHSYICTYVVSTRNSLGII